MTVARRRAIDGARHRHVGDEVTNQLTILADEIDEHEAGALPDRRLALLFACTHPALEAAIRTPLMLQVVLGLEAKTIASAFLMSPAAMSKRLVRAKNKIRAAGIPFSVPEREELPGRLAAVLEAVYAVYAEGWTDPVGGDAERRDLTGEALFLAQLLVELLPEEPETLGLLALMLYAQARCDARRDAAGDYVPLSAQDPATWNAPMIDAADALLRRANTLNAIGRFQLEAALQSAHVHRCRTRRPNWDEVVQLYDALFAIAASPVVAVNRALALAETGRPAGGTRRARAVCGRSAAGRLPAVLGRACRSARACRRDGRSARRVRSRDRTRARSGRAPVPAAQAHRVGIGEKLDWRVVFAMRGCKASNRDAPGHELLERASHAGRTAPPRMAPPHGHIERKHLGPTGWRAMNDRDRSAFEDLSDPASFGIVPRSAFVTFVTVQRCWTRREIRMAAPREFHATHDFTNSFRYDSTLLIGPSSRALPALP